MDFSNSSLCHRSFFSFILKSTVCRTLNDLFGFTPEKAGFAFLDLDCRAIELFSSAATDCRTRPGRCPTPLPCEKSGTVNPLGSRHLLLQTLPEEIADAEQRRRQQDGLALAPERHDGRCSWWASAPRDRYCRRDGTGQDAGRAGQHRRATWVSQPALPPTHPGERTVSAFRLCLRLDRINEHESAR